MPNKIPKLVIIDFQSENTYKIDQLLPFLVLIQKFLDFNSSKEYLATKRALEKELNSELVYFYSCFAEIPDENINDFYGQTPCNLLEYLKSLPVTKSNKYKELLIYLRLLEFFVNIYSTPDNTNDFISNIANSNDFHILSFENFALQHGNLTGIDLDYAYDEYLRKLMTSWLCKILVRYLDYIVIDNENKVIMASEDFKANGTIEEQTMQFIKSLGVSNYKLELHLKMIYDTNSGTYNFSRKRKLN